MTAPKNIKTTILGIATILSVLSAALVSVLDGDPTTHYDLALVIAGVTAGVGLILAKDAEKKVAP